MSATPTTNAYRHKIALAAANGGNLPETKYMAFGSGSTPYDPANDTALESEWHRVEVVNIVSGALLTVTGVLQGGNAGVNILREIGVFDSENTLMGRKIVAPKEFEPEGEFEAEITFEY